VAVNCWVDPTNMLGLEGVTATEDRVAEFTVRSVLPTMVPEVAVIVVVPPAMVLTNPLSLTSATDGSDELQVTCVVMSLIVPPE